MSIDLASMISTAFHHNGWSKVMHVVEIFSSVASLSIIIEYVQLSSQDFKSMTGSIVILAGGKCVPTDSSWLKPAQLLGGWFPVYIFWAECQSKSQLVERGSTCENCSSISGLNFSADRRGSGDSLNHFMGIPLFVVAIPTFMVLLCWISEFWEVCCSFSNGVETALTPIPCVLAI